jgi:hypothetical protein
VGASSKCGLIVPSTKLLVRLSTAKWNLKKAWIIRTKTMEICKHKKRLLRIFNSPILATTVTNAYLEKPVYKSIHKRYKQVSI